MASKASSEAPAPGFSVPVPALPKLGRTWYRRGALYWLCRVRTAVFFLLVVAMFGFFALSLYSGFRDILPSTARGVWDVVQVVASCVTFVWGWVTQRRSHRKALLDPPPPVRPTRPNATTAGEPRAWSPWAAGWSSSPRPSCRPSPRTPPAG